MKLTRGNENGGSGPLLAPTFQRGSKSRRSSVASYPADAEPNANNRPLERPDCIPTLERWNEKMRLARGNENGGSRPLLAPTLQCGSKPRRSSVASHSADAQQNANDGPLERPNCIPTLERGNEKRRLARGNENGGSRPLLAPTLQRGNKCRRSSVASHSVDAEQNANDGPLERLDCIPTMERGNEKMRLARGNENGGLRRLLTPTLQRGSKSRRSSVASHSADAEQNANDGPLERPDCIPTLERGNEKMRLACGNENGGSRPLLAPTLQRGSKC